MTRIPVVLIFLVTCLTGSAWAQDSAPPAAPESAQAAASDEKPVDTNTKKPIGRVPPTLMFTIDEMNDIQSRMATVSQTGEESDNAGKADAIENAALYLSTIVYYGPKDWTIWVNGKPIGPEQDFGGSFKITDIGPRYVELLVPLSAQGMNPVRLEPNQTFIAKSGAVVEGQWSH